MASRRQRYAASTRRRSVRCGQYDASRIEIHLQPNHALKYGKGVAANVKYKMPTASVFVDAVQGVIRVAGASMQAVNESVMVLRADGVRFDVRNLTPQGYASSTQRRSVSAATAPDAALSQVSRAMRILDQALGNTARALEDPEQEFYDEVRARWSQIEKHVHALIRLARDLS